MFVLIAVEAKKLSWWAIRDYFVDATEVLVCY